MGVAAEEKSTLLYSVDTAGNHTRRSNYSHVDLDAITDVPRGKQQAKENSGY